MRSGRTRCSLRRRTSYRVATVESGEVLGVRAAEWAVGIIPADESIAIANARERIRIPRFMLDTFGWRGRLGRETRP